MHMLDFKVMLWLDCREFQKKEKLQENSHHDFIVMNADLEKEYDIFKESSICQDLHLYIPANDLLYYWYKIVENTNPVTVTEFGKNYLKVILMKTLISSMFGCRRQEKEDN